MCFCFVSAGDSSSYNQQAAALYAFIVLFCLLLLLNIIYIIWYVFLFTIRCIRTAIKFIFGMLQSILLLIYGFKVDQYIFPKSLRNSRLPSDYLQNRLSPISLEKFVILMNLSTPIRSIDKLL